MILNVSGRCDIVAFYTNWFMKRYDEGFVDVRNPIAPKLVNRIYFKDVDLIVFCTKNPLPIIKYLSKINKPILFHITLTPYGKDIEPNVPPKGKIIEGIKEVSKIIGKENVYVRYDPILLNDKYTIDYHIKAFDSMCSKLNGYVEKIITSFVDNYKNVNKNKNELKLIEFSEDDYKKIGMNFSNSAKKNHMTVQTCYEENRLLEYGFIKKDCVDATLAFQKTGKTNLKKWQARKCECVNMIDIGVYNSCKHFCKYCYANYDEDKVEKNVEKHDHNSSFLIGNSNYDDILKIKRD